MAAKFTSPAGLERWVIDKFKGNRTKALENFKRARALIKAGSVPAGAREVQAVEGADGIKVGGCTVNVAGTNPEPYTVHVELQGRVDADWEGAQVSCTCPAGGKTPLCKHGLAVLLCTLGLEAETAAASVPPRATAPAEPISQPLPPAPLQQPTMALPPAVLAGGRMLPGTLQLGGAQPPAKNVHKPPSRQPAGQPPARMQK